MDNNNPTTPPTPPTVPPETTNPMPQEPSTQGGDPTLQPIASGATPTSSSSGGNKMIWIIAGAVLLLVIIAGGVFYMMSASKAKQATDAQQTKKAVDVSDLKTEADSIPDEDLDADFQQVDKDLKSL